MKKLGIAAAILGIFLVGEAPKIAHAEFIANIEQVGSDVVVTGSGSLDLSGLTSVAPKDAIASVEGSTANLFIGPASAVSVDVYSGISGPSSFGSGLNAFASSGTGPTTGVLGLTDFLDVPSGYVSGTALSDSSTYDNTTLASLGLTPGTYTYTWGTPDDSFVINIGTTPLPAALPLFAGGLGMIGLLARGRKRKSKSALAAA
jgi:hypothetical protein